MRALIKRTPSWAWVWMAFFLLAGCVPVVAGVLRTPSEETFTGALYNPTDLNSYLANMRQGQQGNWLYVMPYTAERSTPVPLYTVYILLGHMARLTGLSLPLVFHMARIGCAGIFVLTAYHFIARFLPSESERKLAFGLLLFTGGLSLFSFLILNTTEMKGTPDLFITEATTFGSLMVNPHFTLVMTFMLWLLLMGEDFSANGKWQAALLAVLSGIGIALVHVHQLVIVGLFIGMTWLARCQQSRNILWIEGLRIAIVFVPVAIVAGAITWLTMRDDLLAAWMAANDMPSPPVWSVVFILYGPLFWLAVVGVVTTVRQREENLYPVALWFVVVLVLIYAPVNIQRRFMEGWHIPIVMLSAVVWQRHLAPGLAARFNPWTAHWVGVIGFACLTLSPILILTQGLVYVTVPDTSLAYMDRDTYQAIRWIRTTEKTNDSDVIVFAGPVHGNVIPAWAMVRTVLGHNLITVSASERMEDVEDFFDASTPHTDRITILRNLNVDYVYFGDEERDLGDFDPDSAAYLEQVFNSETTSIYQFHDQ